MPTLREHFAQLNHRQAVKILGNSGESLLIKGGRQEIDIDSQVFISSNLFRLSLPGAQVSILEDDTAEHRMRLLCTACHPPCEHTAAALSLILEEKSGLGLARKAHESELPADLSEEELLQLELARRQDRANRERYEIHSQASDTPWTDHLITSLESGKTYRVAFRGWDAGESYCSCPDFRKNTLGTCKHILHLVARMRERFPAWQTIPPFSPSYISLYLSHGRELSLKLKMPEQTEPLAEEKLRPYVSGPISDIPGLLKAIASVNAAGIEVIIYPDVEEYLSLWSHRQKLNNLVSEIRSDPQNHPLRTSLLKVPLLPYQLDGIAFVCGMGRAVLADDMGLGKTIQGIGVAELLALECDIKRVLIICPASVKGQWKNEIDRFSGRETTLVGGRSADREGQYLDGKFFTICNYEQVLRDLKTIEAISWDLILLDEGQRIKNWEAKTSQTIKALKSQFALVLSGTPLENRLEELYSVVEFIDDRRLGPGFRFHRFYRVDDPKGRMLGYRNLDQLREQLRPVLLRRTRDMVDLQLPERSTQIVEITPTAEQLELHNGHMSVISAIIRKRHISEMDLLKLQKALLLCRMCANGTFLVDKTWPGYSSKLERLSDLLSSLSARPDRKMVLFSEWTSMLNAIERAILTPQGISFVRLDGSVPQHKRQAMVKRFMNDDSSTLFMTTNAGATGLNLQAANTVINVDLPWNPAVLEQRIGRAHRMGQKRPVEVFLLVTSGTIEENMLGRLAAKRDLSHAALDLGSDLCEVAMSSGIDELKKRLEQLLSQKPPAPIDESQRRRMQQETERLSRQKQVEEKGGELISAIFSFMGALLPAGKEPDPTVVESIRSRLAAAMDQQEDGSMMLRLRMPPSMDLSAMARTMALMSGPGD